MLCGYGGQVKIMEVFMRPKFFFLLLFLQFTLFIATNQLNAQNLTVTITSDNAYVYGFGDINGIIDYHYPGVANILAHEIYSPNTGTETYTIAGSLTGKYIYIAAWSDELTYQGTIAQFSDGNTTILTSPTLPNPFVHWEVFATGIDLDPQTNDLEPTSPLYTPRRNSNCPTLSDVNTQIAIANQNAGIPINTSVGWVTTTPIPGRVGVLAFGSTNHANNYGFPAQTVSGIDPNAQWMWYDPDPNNIAQPFVTGSFPNFPADKSREYYIFRVGPLDSLFSTGQNHYKTWRIEPLPVDTFALIRDQFTSQDRFHLSAVHFISNPVRKIINSPVRTDTFNIIRPDDHLTWYRAEGKAIAVQVEYSNQFEHTKVFLDSVKYFLVPTQKFPHAQPERLDHYTAYRIRNPISFVSRCELQDQFDQHDKASEFIDTLSQVYFLTPTGKNKEPVYDTITHYVAYEIHPKRRTSQTWSSSDQFGSHRLQVLESSHLLVPTKKLSVSPTGVIEESELPTGFALLQSYPNPFNPTTTIEYHVPVEGFIKLSVFDVLGREIAVLVNGNVQAGKHKVTFDASSFAAGVYFYRMQAGKFRESRKLILLK